MLVSTERQGASVIKTFTDLKRRSKELLKRPLRDLAVKKESFGKTNFNSPNTQR